MSQRIGQLLKDLPALRQIEAMSRLQAQLDAVLPERFRGQAMAAALHEGELRVLCANGAIASRLRLEAAQLAEAMQARGATVRRLDIKVRPQASPRTAPPLRNKKPLPEAAQQAFTDALAQMEEGEVKDALRALLKHHKPGS